MKTETGQKTKILKSDEDFEDWLAKDGIDHQVTPPYTTQINGVAERVNRTVVESACSQMYGRKVPLG
jgi:transposase InsO family protein